MKNQSEIRNLSNVGLKILTGMLVISLMCSPTFTVFASESIPFRDIDLYSAKTIYSGINYTQMALEFVENYYPDKNYSVFNSSVRIPYTETGFNYQQIEIDITPGASSPFDTVIITIRHDTLNIEFGTEQYLRDYEEYCNNLPRCYKKMSTTLRQHISHKFGPLSPLTMASPDVIDVAILVLEKDQSLLISKINRPTYQLNSGIESQFKYLYIGTSLTLPELVNISSLSCVKCVLLNQDVHIEANLKWSGPYIGATQLHIGTSGHGQFWGNGSTVGIMDTGVGDLLNQDGIHPAIEREAIVGGYRGLIDRRDFTGNTLNPQDVHGHGTHVAGIIGSNGDKENGEFSSNVGIAPNAALVSAKILGNPIDAPTSYAEAFIEYKNAINWLLSGSTIPSIPGGSPWNGVDIIQASFGWKPEDPMFPNDPLYNNGQSDFSIFADYVVANSGVSFISSAGNDGINTYHRVCIPADAYNVITVGAIEDVTTFTPVVADYSSYGDTADGRQSIDLVAPGTNIYSTAHKWKSYGNPEPTSGDDILDETINSYDFGYDYIQTTGTSQASPHVSGVAALMEPLLRQKGYTGPGKALLTKAILLNSAEKLDGWTATPTKPLDEKQGAGLVDATGAIATLVENQFCVNNFITMDKTYHHFIIEEVPTTFAATLVWNRHVSTITDSETGETSYNGMPLNNLNLNLYKMTAGASQATLIAESRSSKDNVEHIYYQITQPGVYAIEVSPISLTSDNYELTAIAFSHASFSEGSNLYINVQFPQSNVQTSGVYWRNTSPITITATASNGLFTVKDVSLRYRYQATPTSAWTGWVTLDTDTYGVDGWSWSFPWQSGGVNNVQGSYQFYSIATDYAGNVEAAPASADAGYGYDVTIPTAFNLVTPPSPANGASTDNHRPTLDWGTSTDALSGVSYYRLLVDDSSGFGSPLINAQTASSKTDYTSADYPSGVYLSDITYYWKVIAFDYAGNYRECGSPWSFTPYTPPAPQTGNACGTVKTTSGTAISGATVTATNIPTSDPGSGNTIFSSGGENTIFATTTTDGAGSWGMQLNAATYDFTASKTGYNSKTIRATVPATGQTIVNFQLSPTSSGGGGGGGGGCLVAGTNIATPDGDVKIEEIRSGYLVLSYDEQTGAIEPKMAYHLTVHEDYAGYLEVNGRLRITVNHPIYTTRGLIEAGELLIGDVMMTLNGTEVVTHIEEITEPVTVYNFEVEDNHNYFADGILVHNVVKLKTGCPFIHVWDGTGYAEENNILPVSTNPDRTELDVTDYYMLTRELVPVNDTYSLLLQENLTEQTFLDELELVTIDYSEDVYVSVTPEGEIRSIYDPIIPTSCTNETGVEMNSYIGVLGDGNSLDVQPGDTLMVAFPPIADFTEAKLVIKHKTGWSSFEPYDIIIQWIDQLKCSIHVQVANGTEWVDVGVIPERVNWVIDIVDITSISPQIERGDPIRLLITGNHMIDYIGLDTTDTVPFEKNYLSPFSAKYSGLDDTEMAPLIQERDERYMSLGPGQSIEIGFPYQPNAFPYRAVMVVSHGHYYTLPEIDIVQPVQIKASVIDGTEGEISFFVKEANAQGTSTDLVGIKMGLNDWPIDGVPVSFDQNPRTQYLFTALFENCASNTVLRVEVSSFRGTKAFDIAYSSIMGAGNEKTYPLDDILWNVTGVSFDKISGRIVVLKDTLLQFDINEYYQYDTTTWNNYTWNFGDGMWTQDIRPTHVYDSPGIYKPNLTVENAGPGTYFYSEIKIEVVESPPIASIDIFQETEITLAVAGRKDNTVGIRIYEDGTIIQSYDVKRTAGPPNTIIFWLKKYLGRLYEFELVYNANHKGANPAWLNFTSGEITLIYFKELNTKNGYSQIISVPTSYLDDVVANNLSYWFDASGSYDIDGEIASYRWNFGDGSTSWGMIAQHTFAGPGLYTVILIVTDDDGAVAREMLMVEVCQAQVECNSWHIQTTHSTMAWQQIVAKSNAIWLATF